MDGKAALLAAAVRYADGVESLPAALPVPAPAEGELAALVADRLGREVAELQLVKALTGRSRPGPATEVGAELTEVITDLCRRLARHRIGIKLVDRCAPELPDLGAVWFGTGLVDALTDYLTRHAATGAVRLPGPVRVVARTTLETCVLWAVHLHWDPSSDPGDRELPPLDVLAATVAGLFTHGLVNEKGTAR